MEIKLQKIYLFWNLKYDRPKNCCYENIIMRNMFKYRTRVNKVRMEKL